MHSHGVAGDAVLPAHSKGLVAAAGQARGIGEKSARRPPDLLSGGVDQRFIPQSPDTPMPLGGHEFRAHIVRRPNHRRPDRVKRGHVLVSPAVSGLTWTSPGVGNRTTISHKMYRIHIDPGLSQEKPVGRTLRRIHDDTIARYRYHRFIYLPLNANIRLRLSAKAARLQPQRQERKMPLPCEQSPPGRLPTRIRSTPTTECDLTYARPKRTFQEPRATSTKAVCEHAALPYMPKLADPHHARQSTHQHAKQRAAAPTRPRDVHHAPTIPLRSHVATPPDGSATGNMAGYVGARDSGDLLSMDKRR